MATKTLEAAETNENTPSTPTVVKGNPGDESFLKLNYPKVVGERISVTHISGRSFRVNVRKPTPSGIAGLIMQPIVRSSFVTVVALSDGSPSIQYAPRQ